MMATKWLLSPENIHNWRNRADEWADYYDGLPQDVRDAILEAHDAHHQGGGTAYERACELAERFPCLDVSRY
jgi:hypothetical protein